MGGFCVGGIKMQPWARQFYRSKAWLRCREAYYASQFGLCERCSGPGLIVHHKVKLMPQNISDISVTLERDNLQLLCLECHNREHGGASTVEGLEFDAVGDIIQVYPPPCKN